MFPTHKSTLSASDSPSIGINPTRLSNEAVRRSYVTDQVEPAVAKSYACAVSPHAQEPLAPSSSPSSSSAAVASTVVEHQATVGDKVDVDPTRNVQHYLQRDKTEFEPFSTVCILAIRCVVPGAKLNVTPPLLSLDRSASLIRSISSYLYTGLTQNVIYQLLTPLERAIKLYLRQETLHIFKLAEAGLKSLQEIYKHSNAEQALQQMITLLQDAYAPSKILSTALGVPSSAGEPFANLWHPSEISAVAALFSTVNIVGLINKENAAIWTATCEHMLRLKLAPYL